MSSPGPVQVMPFDAAAASALCTLARSLGCACVRIDLAGCIDKKALLAEIAHALEFPEWFGNNWDALFDCLADLGWLPAKGHVLVLENAAELRAEAPEVFDTALAIFEDAAASWASRGAAFRVFVSA